MTINNTIQNMLTLFQTYSSNGTFAAQKLCKLLYYQANPRRATYKAKDNDEEKLSSLLLLLLLLAITCGTINNCRLCIINDYVISDDILETEDIRKSIQFPQNLGEIAHAYVHD